jgi:hypothetical protein
MFLDGTAMLIIMTRFYIRSRTLSALMRFSLAC